ncbi:MAG: chorismate pyruvate-lyase family protein [Pseudomonadota bacterium]
MRTSDIRRQPFRLPTDSAEQRRWADYLLPLLLTQDGSTTRACETILGGPVHLRLVHQRMTDAVPPAVRALLPSDRYIERLTSKDGQGHVMMDALSYIAVDRLPEDILRDLEAGIAPMGYLLPRLWVRRTAVEAIPAMHEALWAAVGCPDPSASRTYRVEAPEGPLMVIAETFRRGMVPHWCTVG